MYSLLRAILFRLPPELSHELALDWLGAAERLRVLPLFYAQPVDPVEVMGIRFPNAVGLAAGLDKNADYYQAMFALGFGFVEVGTVTPKAQSGNPKPRLFRLPEANAIINRMGFNNKGLAHLVSRVEKRKTGQVLGINIGKNKVTPEDQALNDYLQCMNAVYPYADYITVNISSPNTPGLRNLQFGDTLNRLLNGIKEQQLKLASDYHKKVPVVVKIAPDMAETETLEMAKALLAHEMDGVIATNTTIGREGVESHPLSGESGGLSGLPVQSKSTKTIKLLASALGGQLPIIGVGGILKGQDAKQKVAAGASLVQIYTGFIYRGPELIKESVEAIKTLR